jgi:hypothetical protein
MGLRRDFPETLGAKLSREKGTPGWEEPPLTIRMKNGEVHPEYSVVKLSLGFPP